MNAVLNITFLWVPQILFPTFIAEMEHPEDFPKSLAVLAGISAVLFIVPPAIGFRYLGQYATAPAFGSLGVVAYKKASFAFVIVPTLVIGVIYANVTAKFIYFRVMGNSRHAHSNTIIGWGTWVGIMAAIWAIGFVFAEVIPSMGDFREFKIPFFRPKPPRHDSKASTHLMPLRCMIICSLVSLVSVEYCIY